MKKKILLTIIIISIVAMFILVPYFFNRKLENVLGVDFNKVTEIKTSSGRYGKTISITDKDIIVDYLSTFNNIKIKKSFNQQINDGYALEARLYIGEKEVASFYYGYNQFTINKHSRNIKYTSNISIDKEKIRDITEKYNLSN